MEIVKPDPSLLHNCRTCPHWHFTMQTKEGKGGECRLNPPTLHMLPVETLQGVGMSLRSQFPTIMESAWCGQHPARLAQVRSQLAFNIMRAFDADRGAFKNLVRSFIP